MSQRVTRSHGPADEVPETTSVVHQTPEQAHLEKELAFYSSYHSNKINKLIHFIFIPQILWSAMMLLGYITVPGFINFDINEYLTFRPSAAMLLVFGYQFYYVLLDEIVGGTFLPFMALMYLTATNLITHVPAWLPLRTAFTDLPSALPFALAVHIHAWLWQFFGHFKFEGRAPALTENLVQALVTAPFFVWIETLFYAFNWNPSLHKRIVNLSSQRIVAMNKAKRENGKKTE